MGGGINLHLFKFQPAVSAIRGTAGLSCDRRYLSSTLISSTGRSVLALTLLPNIWLPPSMPITMVGGMQLCWTNCLTACKTVSQLPQTRRKNRMYDEKGRLADKCFPLALCLLPTMLKQKHSLHITFLQWLKRQMSLALWYRDARRRTV